MTMKAALCLFLVSGVAAIADSPRPHAPLFDGLGNLHHPVTTASKQAQRYFDQGLSLCYAFNHKEAIRSFEAASRHDTNLAMAFWGVAYAYGPHVNKPMSKEENDSAWSALRRAQALRASASPKAGAAKAVSRPRSARARRTSTSEWPAPPRRFLTCRP